jgi:hypothetical protein
MEKKTKAILGAAAGVAGAAAVAGIIAARRSSGGVTTYRVGPGEEGWAVGTDGAQPSATFPTKREAVTAGRKLATENAPSHLIIQRADGTIQTRHAYGIDEG